MRGSDVSAMTGEYFCGEDIVLFRRLDLGNMETIEELGKPVIGIRILAPWTAREAMDAGRLVALPLGKRKLEHRRGILHQPVQNGQ